MDDILTQMLKHYKVDTIEEQKNALKEILQEVILSALSRSGFFKEAAFYGGTALRIFYDLDRFSEDLDFSLLKKDENFSLEKYFSFIEAELTSLGLHFEVAMKDKSTNSHIQSAFLKEIQKNISLQFSTKMINIYIEMKSSKSNLKLTPFRLLVHIPNLNTAFYPIHILYKYTIYPLYLPEKFMPFYIETGKAV